MINSGTTLTIGSGITVRGRSGTIGMASVWGSATNVNFVNYGTITADSVGAGIYLDGTGWRNEGIVRAQGGTILGLGTSENFLSQVLTGGTWQVFPNSALRLANFNININAANLLLEGPNIYTGIFSNLPPFSGVNALGNLTTNAGTVTVNGASNLPLPSTGLENMRTGSLNGTGTIQGAVTNNGQVNPGPVAAGGSGPGILTITGNYTQGTTGALNLQLNGLLPGSQYDRLAVNGTVSLVGSLEITRGFASLPGDRFVLVDNDGTDAIVGTFAGLPEGASLVVDGQRFQISYRGNTGNDVVLTQLTVPDLAISDVSVNEGDSGTVNAVFTVTLAAASALPVMVSYATANGTASAPADYQGGTGTLTFNPGETARTITVLVNGDAADEPNETFLVNLSNPVNASLADAQGQGTIVDDDPFVRLFIPTDLAGAPGATVTVPIQLQVTDPTGTNLAAADVALSYDPTRFSVSNPRLGSLLEGFGFAFHADAPGQLRLVAFRDRGPQLAFGTVGSVFLVDFTILPGAAAGGSPINLRASLGGTSTGIHDNDLRILMLLPAPTDAADDPVDGLFTVTANAALPAAPARPSGASDRWDGFPPDPGRAGPLGDWATRTRFLQIQPPGRVAEIGEERPQRGRSSPFVCLDLGS